MTQPPVPIHLTARHRAHAERLGKATVAAAVLAVASFIAHLDALAAVALAATTVGVAAVASLALRAAYIDRDHLTAEEIQ